MGTDVQSAPMGTLRAALTLALNASPHLQPDVRHLLRGRVGGHRLLHEVARPNGVSLQCHFVSVEHFRSGGMAHAVHSRAGALTQAGCVCDSWCVHSLDATPRRDGTIRGSLQFGRPDFRSCEVGHSRQVRTIIA